MRVVIGVDWSDRTFNAVQAVTRLYRPQELVLVHGVDVRPFENSILGSAISEQAYREVRESMVKSGEDLLTAASHLIPSGVGSVRRLCQIAAPVDVILETVRFFSADLVVVGARGLGRLSEFVLGSVSHQVLLQAPCSTFVMKGSMESVDRVLVAVEGPDDAEWIKEWLQSHPFNSPVELSVVTAIPSPFFGDPVPAAFSASFREEVEKRAWEFVDRVAAALTGPHYTAKGKVLNGSPPQAISEEADRSDLLMVGSHGRKGLKRFFLGSVSHSLVHRVPCPILVIRSS